MMLRSPSRRMSLWHRQASPCLKASQSARSFFSFLCWCSSAAAPCSACSSAPACFLADGAEVVGAGAQEWAAVDSVGAVSAVVEAVVLADLVAAAADLAAAALEEVGNEAE